MEKDKKSLEELEKLARVYSDGFRITIGKRCREENILYPACSSGSMAEWSYKNGYFSIDLENHGGIECFLCSKKDDTTAEMLAYNAKLHKDAIISVFEHLS